jgi:hypothetical protein
MATTDPTAPERRPFPSRPPESGWCLAATVALAIAGIGLSIWVPYHDKQQRKQKFEEAFRSFEKGAVDPDPDFLRQIEQINESQRSLDRLHEGTQESQKALPD